MAVQAKEGIVSMESETDVFAGNDTEIEDGFGNILNPQESEDPDESAGEDDEGEDSENLDSDEDDLDGEDGAPKGMSPKLYKTFSAQKKELAKLKELVGDKDIGGLDRDAAAFRELMVDPGFQKYIGTKLSGQGSAPEATAPDLSKIDFNDMSDADIASMMVEAVKHELNQGVVGNLTSQIGELKQVVNGLVGKITDGEVNSFLADEKNYPGAKGKETAIRAKMKALGCSQQDAYFAVMGPELVKEGKQAGLKSAGKKRGKQVHIASRSNRAAPNKQGMPSSIKDAFRAACEEQGVDPNSFQ